MQTAAGKTPILGKEVAPFSILIAEKLRLQLRFGGNTRGASGYFER